jgi:hypothetical protein
MSLTASNWLCGREATPQQLVERKQAAVNNQRLAGVGVALGVARHLRHQSQELFGAVTEFSTALMDLLHAEVDAREGWAHTGAEGHLDASMGMEGEEEEEEEEEQPGSAVVGFICCGDDVLL